MNTFNKFNKNDRGIESQKPKETTSHNLREISRNPKSIDSIAQNARESVESNLQQDNKFLSKLLENKQFFDEVKYEEKQSHAVKHYFQLVESSYSPENPNDRMDLTQSRKYLEYGRNALWTLIIKEAEQNPALRDTLQSLADSSNSLYSDLQGTSSQVEEPLHTIIPTETESNLDQSSSDHTISSKEHLYALVDSVIASKTPNTLYNKRFNKSGFLQSIGIAVPDSKKAQITIRDQDHNTWKKYLDSIRNIDTEIRTKTHAFLAQLEEKHKK